MGAPSATSPAAPVTAGKPGLRNHHGNDQLMRTAIVATLAAAVGFYFGHRHGQAMHPAEAAVARRLEELRTASSSVLQPYVPKPVYTGSDGDDWTHSMSTRVREFTSSFQARTMRLRTRGEWAAQVADAEAKSKPRRGDDGTLMAYDWGRFARFSFLGVKNADASQISLAAAEAHARMGQHSIEKGLALRTWQSHRGYRAISSTDKHTRRVQKVHAALGRVDGDDFVTPAVASAMREYAARHKQEGLPLPDVVQAALERLGPPRHDNISSLARSYGGTRLVTPDEVLASSGHVQGADLAPFFSSRHSVRQFDLARKVEPGLIVEAVRRALEVAPSVCNRQGGRAYMLTSRAAKAAALQHQNGNAGWGHEAAVVLVLTAAQESYVQGEKERYQGFVDGGMWAMAVLMSLHSVGLASCALNWAVDMRTDRSMRRSVGIPESDSILMLVAVGHYPQLPFRVAASPRKPLADVLFREELVFPPLPRAGLASKGLPGEWVADGPGGLRRYNTPGHCGETPANSGCAPGELLGSWDMSKYRFGKVERCVELCRQCEQCLFISYSAAAQDCSWYAACDVAGQPGYQGAAYTTLHVRDNASSLLYSVPGTHATAPDRRRAATVARRKVAAVRRTQAAAGVGKGGGRAEEVTGMTVEPPHAPTVSAAEVAPAPWCAASSRLWRQGYCAVTEGATDCSRDDLGSWRLAASETSSLDALGRACMRRCLTCERCHFISFSLEHEDCSWFAACETEALKSHPAHFFTLPRNEGIEDDGVAVQGWERLAAPGAVAGSRLHARGPAVKIVAAHNYNPGNHLISLSLQLYLQAKGCRTYFDSKNTLLLGNRGWKSHWGSELLLGECKAFRSQRAPTVRHRRATVSPRLGLRPGHAGQRPTSPE